MKLRFPIDQQKLNLFHNNLNTKHLHLVHLLSADILLAKRIDE